MHMNRNADIRRRAGDERGGALVIFTLFLPVLVLLATFVVDVGNWFEHKRHLQMQVDAGALAGGSLFSECFDDQSAANTAINDEVRKYAGADAASYNRQIGGSNQGTVTIRINQKTYEVGGPGPDDTVVDQPCAARMIDVKGTEANLPWFFGLVPGSLVPAINAHARVTLQGLQGLQGGALPIGVPDPSPTSARAFFVNETTGAVIASTPLTKTGLKTADGIPIWDSAPVAVDVNTSRIGVRVALSSGATTTCGNPGVICYDLGSPNGLLFIRGYSTVGRGADTNPPVAKDVRLSLGTCTDAYFSPDKSSCTVAIQATVDIGGVLPANTRVTAFGGNCGNGGCILTPPSTTGVGLWSGSIPTSAGAGPVSITLEWRQIGGGTVAGKSCTGTFNNTKCTGFFENGAAVQRAFRAVDTRSGPIDFAQVWQGGTAWANSFALGTSPSLVVKIGIDDLSNADNANDKTVILRVADSSGSRNHAIDCDAGVNFRTEIRTGCKTPYQINTGQACPNAVTPKNCVPVETGDKVGQLRQGMNDRIGCAPNNWPPPGSPLPDFDADDPRVLPVFITPFASFEGSGGGYLPITNFAVFYVTGWDGGSGCAANEPYPATGSSQGNIWGHFVKYVFSINGEGDGQPCDFSGLCTVELTN
jgi:hypothetical protein